VDFIEERLRLAGDVPFADQARFVTRAAQQLGQEPLGVGQLIRAAVVIPRHAKALLIRAGHQPEPAGRARGAGDIAIGETHLAAREAVELRRGHVLAAVAAEVAVAQVVGEDDDEIRLRRKCDLGNEE